MPPTMSQVASALIHEYARAREGSPSPAASNTTSTTASKPAGKKVKHIDYVKTTTGYWHWYIVAGVVGALTLYHLITLARNRVQRRARAAQLQANKEGGPEPAALKNVWVRGLHTVEAAIANFFLIKTFPFPVYEGVNVSDMFFSIAYFAVCLGLTFYRTYRESSQSGS